MPGLTEGGVSGAFHFFAKPLRVDKPLGPETNPASFINGFSACLVLAFPNCLRNG
jgi:hypothetical protein